jgi:hypothetical protein
VTPSWSSPVLTVRGEETGEQLKSVLNDVDSPFVANGRLVPNSPGVATSQGQRGARFMSAFNDIEHHLRSALGAAQYVEFADMVREFANSNTLTHRQVDALFAFRSLRNAICHSHYYHGQPIAEPVMEVVRQIERLRDQIKKLPKAIDVLGKQDISSVDLDEPIGTALEYIRDFDYSQLPVYRQQTYVGLLTTNAVARWLASQLASNEE